MQCCSNSPGVKIHVIEIPIAKDTIYDARRWLSEQLGSATWSTDALATPVEDPDYIMMSNHIWDGYILPASFRAFFRIKGHDNIAMMFKLTFGGKSDNL